MASEAQEGILKVTEMHLRQIAPHCPRAEAESTKAAGERG